MMTIEKRFEKTRSEIEKVFRSSLISIIAYGSAAVNDSQTGSDEINILVVLQSVGLDEVDSLRKLIKPLSKMNVATPLLMSLDHIKTSTDVFPIEFLEIQEKHRVLHGADIMDDLKIETINLRHECEHELKGRILRLRQSYMEIGENVKALTEIILAGHKANFPAFRTALRLKGIKPPLKKEEVTAELCNAFELNQECFLKLKLLRQGELKPSFTTLRALLNDYLDEVEKVAAFVDSL